MFSNNHRISQIQMERQYFLAYLGPVLLWIAPGFEGRWGIFAILAGTLLLCLWMFCLQRQLSLYRYPQRYWGGLMSKGILLIYESYLVLTGGWLAAGAGRLLQEYMIEGMNLWAAVGVFVLAALGGSKGLQERGRFAQTVWPAVGILLGFFLILAAFRGQGGSALRDVATNGTEAIPAGLSAGAFALQDVATGGTEAIPAGLSAGAFALQNVATNGTEAIPAGLSAGAFAPRDVASGGVKAIFAGGGASFVHGIVWFLSAFLGTLLLPFLETDETKGRSSFGRLAGMVGRMALWTGLVVLLLWLSFGERGAENLSYPVLNLMAGVRAPGGFIQRTDMIFLTIVLFALLFTLSSIFFYSAYIGERAGIWFGRLPAVVLCFWLGTADFGEWTLAREYPRILAWIYLPLFLVLTFCQGMLKHRRKKTQDQEKQVEEAISQNAGDSGKNRREAEG